MKHLLIVFVCLGGALFGAAKKEPPKPVVEAKKVQPPKPQEPTIRVLIAKNVNAALLEVKGPYCVLKEDTKDPLSSGSVGKRFVVQPIDAGLRWGEEYPDVYQISVLPRSSHTMMYVNGMQYKGSLSVYSTPRGEISIVNDVAIEDYLKSTLTAEGDALSKEAMASLVIAKRTAAYVLALQNKGTERLYDVAAADTSYYGHGITKQKDGVEELVDNTKHIVLLSGVAPVMNVALTKENAEELASKGYDAKKILKTICPEASLGTNVR